MCLGFGRVLWLGSNLRCACSRAYCSVLVDVVLVRGDCVACREQAMVRGSAMCSGCPVPRCGPERLYVRCVWPVAPVTTDAVAVQVIRCGRVEGLVRCVMHC